MRRAVGLIAVVGLAVTGLVVTGGLPASGHIGHSITVSDGAVNEGAVATVTVKVTPATQNIGGFAGRQETITVGVSTVDGTAVAPGDYATKAQTLTFAPGQSTKTFTATTAQDAVAEGNETFTVRLSNPTFTCVRTFGPPCPSSGSITDDTGLVTIVDDEAPPPPPGNLSVADQAAKATVDTDCVHAVTLSPASTIAVTVDFAATGAINQLGNTTGSLSFAPGETTQNITLDVVKQKKKLGVVTVTLSNAVGANIVDGSATCTIKKKKKK